MAPVQARGVPDVDDEELEMTISVNFARPAMDRNHHLAVQTKLSNHHSNMIVNAILALWVIDYR